ncbi:MAG TPA: protein-glutamate O-methyltransferase [Phycisphaerae bacterium]|nr:protein-glutamate O-methyltransferase [Phycisphaerae bacterium]
MLLTQDITVTARDFRRISEAMYAHCGINLHDGKEELVQARLAKLLRKSGEKVSEYLDRVLENPGCAEFTELVDSLSTNLTSFFRESNHFTYLAGTFLPALFARKKARGEQTIRGWSAACSSGEEPYTLAMVTLEAMESAGVTFDAKILATDISTKVLEIAKGGLYDRQRTHPVPPALKAKYLISRKDKQSEVSPALRNVVRFGHMNLVKPWPFTGPLDFIFCRNVMIYFDKPTQQGLVNRFHEILAPGGMLFTGHSESLTGVSHPFRFIQPTIYEKS